MPETMPVLPAFLNGGYMNTAFLVINGMFLFFILLQLLYISKTLNRIGDELTALRARVEKHEQES